MIQPTCRDGQIGKLYGFGAALDSITIRGKRDRESMAFDKNQTRGTAGREFITEAESIGSATAHCGPRGN
jgi:hypothetical protein